jgi:hypothetical protein
MQLPDYQRTALTLLLVVALTCAFLPAVATAQTTAIFTGTGEGENIYSRYYSNYVSARVFFMNVGGTNYEGYCIDLFTTIRVGDTLLVNGPLSEEIWDEVDWCAVNYIVHHYGDRNGPGNLSNRNTEAAAVQAAIWYLVTEPYGGTGPPGPYQFMNDLLTPTPYDAYRQTTPRDTVRNRAFEMIANASPGGSCTFRYPVNITLSPKVSDIAPNGTPGDFADLCALVTDQNDAGLGGITVEFVNAGPGGGELNVSSAVTDSDGNACIRFYAPSLGGENHTHIDAYVTGDYGTFLFDPGQNRQSVTTLSLLPYSITDRAQVFWTVTPSIVVRKYLSTDNHTWTMGDITPISVLEGSDVYYRYIVINDGDVAISGISLTDNVFGNLANLTSLDPGESSIYYYGPISADEGEQCNIANVTGDYQEIFISNESRACYNGTPTYSKSGRVFTNVSGTITGIPDVTIWICRDCDDAFPVPTVNITRTNATGYYLVTGLLAGDYNVSVPRYTSDDTDANEGLFDTYQPLLDGNVRHITFTNEPFEVIARQFSVPPDSTGNDFEFYPYGNISGIKWKDYNGDGIRGINDEPLSGWVIALKYENGTVVDTKTTAADGSYRFGNLTWGKYLVSETLKSGWKQTFPAGKTYLVEINATSVNVACKDFGNQVIPDCCACPIKAYFTYKQVSSPARTIQFTDKSTGYVTDWSWTFGDGTTSVERNPTKTYGKKGTYTVKQFAQTIKCDGKTAWVSYTAKVTVK